MNIFYFSADPVLAAQAQPDKMLVKMVLETAQMLSTAHRVLDGDEQADAWNLYKIAHKNHPCSIWVRKSSENYSWLYKHFLALSEEYSFRYNKKHKTSVKLTDPLLQKPNNIIIGKRTPVAQAMPDIYKNRNPIAAYRNYCIHEKHYAKWEKGRSKPTWWN